MKQTRSSRSERQTLQDICRSLRELRGFG